MFRGTWSGVIVLVAGLMSCSGQAWATALGDFPTEIPIPMQMPKEVVIPEKIPTTGSIFPESTLPGFIQVGPMTAPRDGHTATLLENGKVLILGGISNGHVVNTAELFDPVSQTFASLLPDTMISERTGHTATLLLTGKVLIASGWNGSYTNTAEMFDPIRGQFKPLLPLASARWGHTATRLQGGKVLIAGGRNCCSAQDTAELFDPATDSFMLLPPMASRRYEHTATLLPDGRVLIAGGSTWNGSVDVITNTAEIFDPIAGTFASLAPNTLTRARDNHRATLLPNGKVLIVGGYNGSVHTSTAEVFDPSLGTFTPLTSTMIFHRGSPAAALLTNGDVLIAGGQNGSTPSNTAELFHWPSGTFTLLPSMASARFGPEWTLLENGKVLIVGTIQSPFIEELFDPGGISISGNISYCQNPVPGPVPGVTLTLTNKALGATLSSGSGNYTFAGLASGGSYTVTPTKSSLAPGSAGIDTVDVVATQRHLLQIGTPLSGCHLVAADVSGDGAVNTVDVIAIQRFALAFTSGSASVGTYQFTPANRTYSGLISDQSDQNYDAVVFGDVVAVFVHRPGGPSEIVVHGAWGLSSL